MIKRILFFVFCATGCASVNTAREPAGTRPDLTYCEPLHRRLHLAEECVRPDESARYRQLGARMQAVQMKMPMDPKNQVDHTVGGGVRRLLHAKAHACVKAFVTPLTGLVAPYSQGVFADAKTHPAWIRFSNAQGIVENDNERDARGMAMKVMGVSGPRLAGGTENQTQDFLLTNKPRGTARTAEDFVKFVEASAEGTAARLTYFADGRADQMIALLKVSNKQVDSMVKETYWSGGPFLWGQNRAGQATAAKFKIQPCLRAGGTLPDYLARDSRPAHPDPDYLKEDLKQLLETRDLCMVMSLQIQNDPVKQPIEDGFQEWTELEASPQTIAYIKIPRQKNFDSPEQNDFCERVTFNPWNGLAAHRPLGDLNRARRYVYAAVQQNRLEVLPAPRQPVAEPRPNDTYWNLNPL